MKILDLRIENIGKIKLFELSPDGSAVLIGGRNDQGKTTVLKAIEMLIEGKKAFLDEPVRRGAEEGEIYARLEGGFLVERKIRPDGETTLVIKNEDGARYPSPQTLLDSFRGTNTLDPLRFVSLSAKDQRENLQRLVGLDFTALDKERALHYELRTEVNRKHKDATGQLAALKFDPAVAGQEEISTEQLVEELRNINESVKAYEDEERKFHAATKAITQSADLIEELEKKLIAVKAQHEAIEMVRDNCATWLDENPKPDPALVQIKVQEATAHNEKVRVNKRHEEGKKYLKLREAESDELTALIEDIDKKKQSALAAAKFPVEGLSFDEKGVLYNGFPFSQASGAGQLRVSTAMAFAANPRLKVVLIRDGSKLDDDNLKVICEVAEQYGGHVWIERVGRGEECSVVLEDGEIVENRTLKTETA